MGERDIRGTAMLTDDGELLPPELDVRGDVNDGLREAIREALADAPNATVDPMLAAADGEEWYDARFTANYQEMPLWDDEGNPAGWAPPYRMRERFTAALREHLPDGFAFEAKNRSTTVFYRER